MKCLFRYPFLVLLCVTALTACSEDPITEPRMLVFMERMPPTDENSEYELWYYAEDEDVQDADAEVDIADQDEEEPEPKSLVRFQTETGVVSLSLPITEELKRATTFIVTLEEVDRLFDIASDTVLLGGELLDDEIVLSVSHPFALGNDFGEAVGTYRLDTPTTNSNKDFDQGLWWYEKKGKKRIQSLFLPPLPQGWLYEGWVIGSVEPLSLGKFSDPSRFDMDLAGPAATDIKAPLFPGQDFINPPQLLSGFTAMITAEPNPDNSVEPFEMEILYDRVIESLDVNQPMENRTERSLPRGTIRFSEGLETE